MTRGTYVFIILYQGLIQLSPEGGQVGVVRGGRVADAPLAARVHVAKVVGQRLQLVRGELRRGGSSVSPKCDC